MGYIMHPSQQKPLHLLLLCTLRTLKLEDLNICQEHSMRKRKKKYAEVLGTEMYHTSQLEIWLHVKKENMLIGLKIV